MLVLLISIVILMMLPIIYVDSQKEPDSGSDETSNSHRGPVADDSGLKVETVASDLEQPTSMAFLGPDDILVLEKNEGTVQRIVNGEILDEPILDVNVANKQERGMLGIAVERNRDEDKTKPINVFLYFTESSGKEDGLDICPKYDFCEAGNEPLGNRLYRYELVNNKLVKSQLLLDLPATPGPIHNGGAITIGPDGNIYVAIGNARGHTQTQNIKESAPPDGRGGILRVAPNGELVENKGILSDQHPLNFYYAYGIRNSFGIDFDPVTGILWDTEVGNHDGDEINLVEPGFNSGSSAVQGMAPGEFNESDLVDFGGRGKYNNPEFTWNSTVTPTAIKFLSSDKLGKTYKDDVFIGDFNHGNIYHFDLNENRTQLSLEDALEDKVADTDEELTDATIFAKGFGGVTDLEVGPDGYLYVVSIDQGKIFRVIPKTDEQ
jgi:glucose/arabinose dehydrogenase